MKVVFRNSFLQDIKKLKSKTTIDLIDFIDKGTVEFLKFGTRQNFYSDFPPY